jgi:hypothetical protein
MTPIFYLIGLVVRCFKPLLFIALAALVARAPMPTGLPDWGKWVGSARAYVMSLAGQLHLPSLPAWPQWPNPDSKNRLVVGIDQSNSCFFEGWANGARFDLVADSGAYILVFGRRDAVRLGFNPSRLAFNRPIETANGTGHAARVRIELRIGDPHWRPRLSRRAGRHQRHRDEPSAFGHVDPAPVRISRRRRLLRIEVVRAAKNELH